jgi:rhodanese-related sulfurtransferase
MKKHNFLYLLFVVLFFAAGCKEDEETPVTPPATIDEATELAKYVETNNDYLYAASSFIFPATTYRTEVIADPTKIYTIDIRTATDYNSKHLKGAVNVTMANLYTHIKDLTFANYKYVVVTCYSGQNSAYGVSLVRAMLPIAEANKVVSLKYGMSSIDSSFATNYWLAKLGNARADQFVTTDPPAKPAKGIMPVLATGKKTGKEILEARVEKMLTDGFNITIDHNSVYTNLSNYYVVCYWPLSHYKDPGHISGSYNYEPSLKPFKADSVLKTLPTDKTIILYCYTGQGSAYAGAYLKMLGYDVKSLVYGANAMIYDKMKASTNTVGSTFIPANEIKGYKDLLE